MSRNWFLLNWEYLLGCNPREVPGHMFLAQITWVENRLCTEVPEIRCDGLPFRRVRPSYSLAF
jgi:hypothetical protein